jgi:hypothetical protein
LADRDACIPAFVKSLRWKGRAYGIAAINGAGCRELVYAVQKWLEKHPAERALATAQ